jgi:DnaJ-class molecular chaperone
MTSLLEHIRDVASRVEHERNLRGMTRARCTACNGTGNSEPGYSDRDAHGSYWVMGVQCRRCVGAGSVDVPCSADAEAAAIRREIDALKARLKKLGKSAAKGVGDGSG